MFKKIFAIIILGIGVALSLFLILGNSEGNNANQQLLLTPQNQKNSGSANLDFQKTASLAPLPLPADNQKQNPPNPISDNLTEALSQAYTQKIGEIIQNSGGNLSSRNISNLDLSSLDNEIAKQKTNTNIDFYHYIEKDIKISSDNSSENQLKYIEALDKILKKYTALFQPGLSDALNNFFAENDPKLFNRIISAFPNLIKEVAALPAPDNLKDVHLQLLNVFQKKLTLYKIIANTKTDPLKSYVAIKQIPEVVNEDIQVQTLLNNRYQSLRRLRLF